MLFVDASLLVESAGLRMRIDAHGTVLLCRFDGDVRSALQTLRRTSHVLQALRRAVPIIVQLGLRLEFMAGDFRIARFGNGVQPNALGRLLRLPCTQVGG